jgi:DNA modification methylase|tara:strand:- start:191 stop:1399 length:1209 start_codon:yes stop_codon:yes gene_type:complete
MKIDLIDPEILKTANYNPRQISRDELNKLVKSIKQFGFVDPALVRREDNMIVGGHQRVKAALELKLKEIPIVYLDISENDAKLLNVALNKISGEWDDDKLTTLLSELKFFDDVDELLTGFDENELDELLADLEEPKEGFTDPDSIPDEADPVCKPGELWQLGDHKLLCGDATDIGHVEILMDGDKADMVFTDPPYLMDFTGSVHADGSKSYNSNYDKIKNDHLTEDQGEKFLDQIIKVILQYSLGAYYICFYRLGLHNLFKALVDNKLKYKALIIWNKGNHTLSNSDYMSKYEPIVYGWAKEHNFYGKKGSFDIWDIERTKKNDLHPTMKPVELCASAIINSSVKDNIVLDPFLGSGSTLIACEINNRICYGMELEPKYCDVIIKRWENFTGLKAELVNASL